MKKSPLLFVASLFLISATGVAGQNNPSISGIDTSRLLTRNEVSLYVTVTDSAGNPVEGLNREAFDVSERAEEGDFSSRTITGFRPQANEEDGVTFLMVLDNSGSMYFSEDGRRNVPEEEWRITSAKRALREFLNELQNPLDRVGLYSYNTFYTEHSEPTGEIELIDRLVDEIERPEGRDAYTEMYASLKELASDARALRGRRVVVLLSDGDNYPFAQFSGEAHPEYGERIFTHDEAIEALNEQELTVYSVHFGSAAYDQYLEQIALDTGGLFFNASTGAELADVYREIRRRVLQEYRIAYRASMEPADRRSVRVTLSDGDSGSTESDERTYISGTLFGLPASLPVLLVLLAIAVALLLWLVLCSIRRPNRRNDVNFEVIGSGGRTTIFPAAESGKTVIGGGDADVTVVGPTGLASQNATVAFNEKRGTYTISANSPITVNNRAVTGSRELESGDVIRLSGTLVVFDATQRSDDDNGGDDKKTVKKSTKEG